MPQNSQFDEQERLWVWNYDGQQFFMDHGELIRFKVLDIEFVVPDGTDELTVAGAPGSQDVSPVVKHTKMIMKIYGSISETGLGLLAWWQ
jgi:DNA-directed RNA polymerase III subunit RPC8